MKVLFLAAGAVLAFLPRWSPAAEAPPPAPAVTVALHSGDLTLYPFTTFQFPAPVSAHEDDPVNLVFEGAADPREIRAALLSLDGDRTAYGFPADVPFNCTWADGEGEEQATWTAGAGWEGSAIQLTCGPYAIRFHLRLFRHGGRTLGGTHMDLQVPATTSHQVIAWNFPQQVVTIDLLRSGLLASAPYVTNAFGPTPTHRTMPYYIHNALPAGLRGLLELPLEDTDPAVSQTVDIPCSGRATVLAVEPSFVPAHSDARREIAVNFNQGIPKPFCGAANEWVWVQGPVNFSVRVQIEPSGRYLRTVVISAMLGVTPIDPLTGQPTGPTVPAVVFENHRGLLTDNHAEVRWLVSQTILGPPTQWLLKDFKAGQADRYVTAVSCGAPGQ